MELSEAKNKVGRPDEDPSELSIQQIMVNEKTKLVAGVRVKEKCIAEAMQGEHLSKQNIGGTLGSHKQRE